ncbi:GNAT family N-acetyltransferase [Kribbella sp. NPDC050124]|uniref:GNAT family N-acetyltransferase n=1 Tax=Kribbella sp. NPDC050124 TaxID=3364114 RepID=UPI00379B43A2
MTERIAVRPAVSEDYEEFRALFARALMFDLPAGNDVGRALFEPERALVATDGDEIIGTTRALTRDLSVPGAVVPAAHVTGVGVRATHRRRGVMSELITRQLREVPEAIAVLWASESDIYGRFGYGPAAWGVSYEVDLHRVGPPDVRVRPGEFGLLAAADAVEQLAPLLKRLQERRPGVSGRSELGWQQQLQDEPESRGGKTSRQIVVHRDETGAVDGYALWRGKMNWEPVGPSNEVSVEEVVAIEPAAYRALWHYLLTLDLAAKLEYGHAAVDEPLLQLVTTPTALNRRVSESLWVRVTDVPRALAQRRYAAPVDLVFEVTDDLIPANAGRFRLTADGPSTPAKCHQTDDPADLTLSVRDLGAIYLGGRPLTEFAATGRVTEHRPEALTTATTAFTWPTPPVSIEIF